jgi:hypothetical protein
LEEHVNSREVFLAQINVSKEEAEKDLSHMKIKVTGRSTMKGAKHIIWDKISTTIFKKWSYFSLV